MTVSDFNRSAVALLGAIIFALLLGSYTSFVFAPQALKVPGFALPTSAAAPAVAAAPAAPKETPLPELLAKADAKKGQADAKICGTCHNFDKGGAVKVGPDLWGVVGRPVASAPGFAYSDSRQGPRRRLDATRSSIIGSPIRRRWPRGPRWRSPARRIRRSARDILAYLQSLSDSPVPFPK